MAFRYDSTKLPKLQDTSWGAKRAPANVSRVGVLEYDLGNGQVRRELRLPEEVFAQDSLATLVGVPVTVNHPGMVSLANVRSVRVGGQHGEVRQDGDFVATGLQIEDASTIDRIGKGDLSEISMGYLCRLEMTPGTWRGQRYDAVQRDIQYNHIALLPAGAGRCGPEVALRLDGKDENEEVAHTIFVCDIPPEERHDSLDSQVTMKINGIELKLDERDAAVIKAHLDEKDAKIAQLEAAAGTAAGETATLKQRCDAAEKRVAEFDRAALETDARKVLGEFAKFDGKDDAAVRASVIAKVYPELRLDGRGTEYVKALFDAAVAQGSSKAAPAAPAPQVKEIVAKQDGNEPKKSPRDQMIEQRRNMAALKNGAVK